MDLKKILNNYPQRSADDIIKAIQPYDVVSFDIFDTLIKRDVESETDIFDLIERKYNSKHVEKIKDFKQLRLKAESEAREKKAPKEIVIEDIYDCLCVGRLNKNTAGELLRTEKEVEKAVCIANQPLLAVLNYCKESGKNVIIISDMYWTTAFVEEILKENDITGYSAVYVSSEYGVQKRQNGKLFKIVAERENLNVKTWVHIGDSKKADYVSAKKVGIAVVDIARYYTHTDYVHKSKRDDLDKRVICSFINNRINTIKSDGGEKHNDVKLGYEIYGPQLYFFVKWIHAQIPADVTVLFFARDCYIVKNAYEALYGTGDRFKYFLGSRKSLILAALNRDSSLETVSRLLKSEPAQMTVEGFLKKLNLKSDVYKKEMSETGLHADTVIYRDNLAANSAFVDFYNRILPDVQKKAGENYEGIKNYFRSLNCTNDIVVVDIGWRCTMQFCLQQVFPEHHWKGYYLGVREDAVVSIGDQATGFYINGEDDINKKCFLASLTALIEIFFSAPHGSIMGYSATGEVLYAPYECQDDREHKKFLRDIQRGALQFAIDFEKSKLSENIGVTSTNMLLGLDILNKCAKKRELVEIGNYPFHLGVGVVNAADPKPMWRYIVNPKILLYDFSTSTWKVAFLKRLFKIKLPYYKIFCWIYNHKG